ncbi:MAG: hypothetical protein J5562_07350 [Clostridia bacterium]|nr:hypothetical protein [Clostridia bacterium]
MVGVFAFSFFTFLIVGIFYFFYFDEEKKKSKAELKSVLKGVIIITALVSLIFFIIMCVSASTREKTSQEKYDDMMAGYDWGDHYAYNKQNHSVEWVPWE